MPIRHWTSLVILLAAVVLAAEVRAGEGGQAPPRWTRSRVAFGTPTDWLAAARENALERNAIVDGLLDVATDSRTSGLKRTAILTLRDLQTERAINYCLANVSLEIKSSGSLSPDESEANRPARAVLVAAGASVLPHLISHYERGRLSDADIVDFAHALEFVYGRAKAVRVTEALATIGPDVATTNWRQTAERLKGN